MDGNESAHEGIESFGEDGDVNDTKARKDEKPSHIIGIGASAGGLEALVEFFRNINSETGMAFVVIQHLSPDHKSLMDELLARHTRMEIFQITDGMSLRPDCIYLLPPKKNLAIFNGKLLLSGIDSRRVLNLPIDIFFRSLAEDQEERAIGVILSGTGSDGARGIKAIKQVGGLVIVQDEKSAKFDGMPQSAISTGMVDYIRSPDQMPEVILSYTSHPLISGKNVNYNRLADEETDLTKIIALLRSRTTVDFTYYKPSTVVRRIERRMGIVHAESLNDYLNLLYETPGEIDSLYKDLLIGVTRFFRDGNEFTFLGDQIIPRIFENNDKKREIRIWVVGCSSGEEAYTIAILLQEYMEKIRQQFKVKVFATDIDRQAIERASLGIYPVGIAEDISPGLLEHYFDKDEEGYRIKRHIRELVIFAYQNVIKDPPFTKLDMITCRNLLIYLQPNLQKEVMNIFHFSLNDGGYLFLGTSESVGDMTDCFDTVDPKVKIFRHKGKGALPLKSSLKIPVPFTRPSKTMDPSLRMNTSNLVPAKRLEIQEKYYQELINELSSACMVVNQEGTLLETFGHPHRFLKTPTGKVNLDITKMVPSALSTALSTGIRNALNKKTKIVYDRIKTSGKDGEQTLGLKIAPLASIGENEDRKLLIVLEEVHPADGMAEGRECQIAGDADQHVLELEKEIKFTRENLQATIEELQTSNEELQATNEELLASNEELQSTNEELNSVNEELNTVNSEYQQKILELSELNNDMNNLLRSTEVGTIFLDKQLCIRKFTPAVTGEINLLKQDIGRPISDLSSSILSEILDDVKNVLKTSRKTEKIVQKDGDSWYLIQVLPYLEEQNRIGGVVITLVNITRQKRAEIAFEKQYEMLKKILETTPTATLMVNRTGEIEFANRQAEKELEFSQEKILSLPIESKQLNFTDLEGYRLTEENSPMSLIRKTGKPIEKYIVRRKTDNGHQLVFNITGNPLFNEKYEVDGAVFKFDKMAHSRK